MGASRACLLRCQPRPLAGCVLVEVATSVSCAVQEAYTSLTQKTLAFLRATTAAYDARYIVKIDDDVYLRTDRLGHALRQYETVNAGAHTELQHWRSRSPQMQHATAPLLSSLTVHA